MQKRTTVVMKTTIMGQFLSDDLYKLTDWKVVSVLRGCQQISDLGPGNDLDSILVAEILLRPLRGG